MYSTRTMMKRAATTAAATAARQRNSVLPVLDIAKYYTNRQEFVEELRYACHTIGVFLIRLDNNDTHTNDNHHPNTAFPTGGNVFERMLQETRLFFQQPLSDKLQISYEQSPSFRGYMPLGVENTAGHLDHREQVEYAAEYPSASSQIRRTWPVYERLKCASNPWPDTYQPSLQPATVAFAQHTCAVAEILRDSLCLALKVDPKVFSDQYFGGTNGATNNPSRTTTEEDSIPHWVIKMISYPPMKKEDDNNNNNNNNNNNSTIISDTTTTASDSENQKFQQPNQQQQQQQQQGVGAHTDTNFLTLVLQDEVGGLQVFSQGAWIDVPAGSTETQHNPILVCNLGEQAEVWSRGYFRATPHRVLRNPSTTHNRISVPLFYNPILSAHIAPSDDDGTHKSSTTHTTIEWDRPNGKTEDTATRNPHWRRANNSMFSCVGDNTFKSLARSHPVVFQKHHNDLLLHKDGSITQRRGD